MLQPNLSTGDALSDFSCPVLSSCCGPGEVNGGWPALLISTPPEVCPDWLFVSLCHNKLPCYYEIKPSETCCKLWSDLPASEMLVCAQLFLGPIFCWVNLNPVSPWFSPNVPEKPAVERFCCLWFCGASARTQKLLRVSECNAKHFPVVFQGKSFTRHLPMSQSISQRNSVMPPLFQVKLPCVWMCACVQVQACVCVCVCVLEQADTHLSRLQQQLNERSRDAFWDVKFGGNTNTRHIAVASPNVWLNVCLCKDREEEREPDSHLDILSFLSAFQKHEENSL